MKQYNIEKIVAKNGSPSLKINDFYIHSQYNPEREAENYIKKFYKPHHTHIIFGYGVGHFHEAFKKIRRYNETLITIDPLFDEKLIKVKSKHQTDYIYNSKAIGMLDFILNDIKDEVRTEYTVICALNYDKLFLDLYRDLLQKIRDIQEFNRINDFTLFRYADDWQRNLKLNLLHLTKDASLKNIYQLYDSPVVIASSGPSLLKQLPVVKKFRDKIILISAGSTTKVLINNGVNPDFIVSMDGGEPNYNHFKDLTFNDARLIYTFQNHPKIHDSFSKQSFACNIDGYIGVTEYIENMLQDRIPTIIGGATVANFAFSVAQYITSGPIAFIGQDLAYTNNQTHVSGHNHTDKIHLELTKENKEYLYTDGYYGDKVLTSPPLYSMKLNFEKMILIHPPKNEFYNCTEGGVELKGYTQLPFELFCEKYAILEVKVNLKNYEECLTVDLLKNKFQDEKNKLVEALHCYQLALDVINRNKSDLSFSSKTLKKLEEIDLKVKKIVDETATGTILTPTLFKVSKCYSEQENETQRQKFKRVKEQNIALYEGSQQALQKVLKYLSEAVEMIESEELLWNKSL